MQVNQNTLIPTTKTRAQSCSYSLAVPDGEYFIRPQIRFQSLHIVVVVVEQVSAWHGGVVVNQRRVVGGPVKIITIVGGKGNSTCETNATKATHGHHRVCERVCEHVCEHGPTS